MGFPIRFSGMKTKDVNQTVYVVEQAHPMLHWWSSMGKAERIVAMSLIAGVFVTIVNSTVWAIAVATMVIKGKQRPHSPLPKPVTSPKEHTPPSEEQAQNQKMAGRI
jgi:hypothetical protein